MKLFESVLIAIDDKLFSNCYSMFKIDPYHAPFFSIGVLLSFAFSAVG
ncbi:hypothetical protein [Rickettsiales endosymbiont of Stachyamoeba lipophora]|nr:hypothetical protein [Rickettsiales endosymbiont of Stachyamoeba lipophora]